MKLKDKRWLKANTIGSCENQCKSKQVFGIAYNGESGAQGVLFMKTVRIEDEDMDLLVAYAAHLTLEKKQRVHLAEAIHELLELASSERYQKALKEESAKKQ